MSTVYRHLSVGQKTAHKIKPVSDMVDSFVALSFFQFFYLITEIYLLGTVREMQRWAYEIHSTFLVPGSSMQITPNLEQTAIDEIDR